VGSLAGAQRFIRRIEEIDPAFLIRFGDAPFFHDAFFQIPVFPHEVLILLRTFPAAVRDIKRRTGRPAFLS
jgi:hypothetical protein